MKKENLKTIFTPSIWQVFLCVVASLIIMVAVHWGTLLDIIIAASHTNSTTLKSSFLGYLAAFASLPFTGNIFIILFWGILAALVYIVGLAIANVLIDMRNTVVIKTEFTKPPGAGGAIKHFLTQAGAALILICLLIICGLVIFPLFIQMAGLALGSGLTLYGMALGIGAVCGTAVSLYLIWSLTQVVFTLL